MSINSRVEFSYMDLEKEIEGFHSDYYYLLEEVDTELYKETDLRGLVFVADYLDELQLIEKDMHKLMLYVEAKIEELEQEETESNEFTREELHMYYMQNTI